MTETADHEYVLGTRSDELERLKMQHELWVDLAEAEWDRAGIGAGQTVMDLGCGPGFALRALARRVGAEGRAVGVDVSRRFLEHAQQYASEGSEAAIETHHVDAHVMPFGSDTFDSHGWFGRGVLL
jgi:ubiquinone/menaquinone biosynthesis C-methylase UbiE